MAKDFRLGKPVNLTARVGDTRPDEVRIESLTNGSKEEVAVQTRLFELDQDGQFHLDLPTKGMARGEYDLKLVATFGDNSVTAEDSFVLT